MGIKFERITDGTIVEVERPAQVAALVNSSDLGINASRGQDHGWRLAPEVVSEIDDIKGDMSALQSIAREKGIAVQDITTYHVVDYIFSQQQAAKALADESANKNPAFQESYEARIRAQREAKAKPAEEAKKPVVAKAKSTDKK